MSFATFVAKTHEKSEEEKNEFQNRLKKCTLCGKVLLEVGVTRWGKVMEWYLCDCVQEKMEKLIVKMEELVFKVQELETVVRDLELKKIK